MRVSVIIPTYKRSASLARCLDALDRQTRRPDEILVVARRDDEMSQRLVAERTGGSLRLVTINVPAGRPGFVAALNAGIGASHTEIVCFTDDDAEPRADWIPRILAMFASDPSIGAVGGRDWIVDRDRPQEDGELIVGTVGWAGRIVGRHHLGVGPSRDVAILKGVNLSVRGDLIREIGFDPRLRGTVTEHHSELGLCLKLLRMGYRVVYDPAIAVDHHPQPRIDDSREFGRQQVLDAAHNETLALLEHLSPAGRVVHLLWTTVIGTRRLPGVVQATRLSVSNRAPQLQLLVGNLGGRSMAVLSHLHARAGKFLKTMARRDNHYNGLTIIRPESKSRLSSDDKPLVVLVAHDVHEHGGMERACAELIQRSASEFDFVVVSTSLAPALRPLVAEWIKVPMPLRRPFALKFALFWLLAGRRVRSLNADIIHTVGAIVPCRADVSAIHFCHAGFVSAQHRLAPRSAPFTRKCNTAIARVLALAAERWCYRPNRLRAFAAVSSGVRDELHQHYPGIKVAVTPNGVDLDRYHPDNTIRTEMRATVGLTEQPVALFVGSDWDHKGLAIGLKALSDVRAASIDLRLWVVGSGDRVRFSTMADEFGVLSAVSFFGVREDCERFFVGADMFILPSLYETFSLVGFEAAACGLPVVVTRVHGIGDLVRDDTAGILIERNAESLAEAIAALARDSAMRRQMGERARKGVQRYSWQAATTGMATLYQTLIEESTQARA